MLKRKLIRTVLASYCSLIVVAVYFQKDFSTPVHCVIPVIADSASEVKPVFIPSDSGLNANVIKFAKTYLKKNSYGLAKLKKRYKPSFKVINSVFTQYDIPLDLKYLAVVESNLKINTVSRTGAKGLWQFMPATGREHGLKITDDYDERLHVYKSSVAAAKYLKKLYAEFGDWLLVVAAYNSGPGYVKRAIKRSGSCDFWELQNYLPKETRYHVKKYISIHYYFEEQNS
jgi:membrane-bound lytic murein transglycosylase D